MIDTKTRAKLKRCVGCHDNFYNHGHTSGGGDDLCWSIHDAELVMKKEVPFDQTPPWNQKAKRFLSCYRKKGYGYVGPDVTC